MPIPEIIREEMTMELNDQISVTIFPEIDDKPDITRMRLNLLQIEGFEAPIYLQPDAMLNISTRLSDAVQGYLFSQKQYLDEVHPESGLKPLSSGETILHSKYGVTIKLYPTNEGQPNVDILLLKLKVQDDPVEKQIYMTPCEALELCNAINMGVQLYLYNQEQYRKEILEPRQKLAEERGESGRE